MKKVLLLGDSIRMGYQQYVKEFLEGEYEVVFHEENGRCTATTLWQVNQMFRRHPDIALVHWNNGYWDMHISPPMKEHLRPLPEYVGNLYRIAQYIADRGAKAIFATTTPVKGDGYAREVTGIKTDIFFNEEFVKIYNKAALAVMEELSIPINDLYTLCLEDENYYKRADMIHLTEEGSRRCAEQIAQIVRKELA